MAVHWEFHVQQQQQQGGRNSCAGRARGVKNYPHPHTHPPAAAPHWRP